MECLYKNSKHQGMCRNILHEEHQYGLFCVQAHLVAYHTAYLKQRDTVIFSPNQYESQIWPPFCGALPTRSSGSKSKRFECDTNGGDCKHLIPGPLGYTWCTDGDQTIAKNAKTHTDLRQYHLFSHEKKLSCTLFYYDHNSRT